MDRYYNGSMDRYYNGSLEIFYFFTKTIDALFPGMFHKINRHCEWEVDYFPKYWEYNGEWIVRKKYNEK